MSKMLVWLMLLSLVAISCSLPPETYRINENDNLLIPLGRAYSPTYSTTVSINGQNYNFATMKDDFGNQWAILPITILDRFTELTVSYAISILESSSYPSDSEHNSTWLKDDKYIDWSDETFVSIAKELNLPDLPRSDAVKQIGEYVLSYVEYDRRNSFHPASIPASTTLADGVGVCINRARVFVALCRASGIPSRTVNGIVRDHADPTTYDFHHEWMEYLDEKGFWHPVDLRYVKSYELNDPRYAGFVYGAEEHSWFSGLDNMNLLSGQPVQLENGDIVLYHYHPIFKGARYGFDLIESKDMEYYLIEKSVVVKKTRKALRIEQSPPQY